MDQQATFDKVVTALFKQGKAGTGGRPFVAESADICAFIAYSSTNIFCQYLNEDGSRCAVGCLIPDGHPGLRFSGSVMMLLGTYPDLQSLLDANTEEDQLFLISLQSLHDNNLAVVSINDWPRLFQGWATRRGLVYNGPP